jgi:integrase
VTGTIHARGKGKFLIAIDHGKDPATGKRVRRWHTFKGTKTQAKAEAARLVTELKAGVYVEPSRMTVAQFLETWLADAKGRISPKTFERYGEVCRNNIIPLLGAIRLDQLKPLAISAALAKALESGRRDGGPLSPHTVRHLHGILKGALQWAVDMEILLRNPAAKVEPPKVPKGVIETYSMADTAKLIGLLQQERLFIPAFLSGMTGMRRGEVAALRWRNVNLAAAQLTVVESIEQLNSSVRVKETKTDRGRVLALGPTVVTMLATHKAAQAEELLKLGIRQTDDTFVCAHVDGAMMHPRWISQKWRAMVKASGLPAHGFHHLRHAHATALLQSGVHIKVASERLGHSSTGITLDLYSHVLPGMQEDAAARIDAAYQKAIAGPSGDDNG